MGAVSSITYSNAKGQDTIHLFGEWVWTLSTETRMHVDEDHRITGYQAMECYLENVYLKDCEFENVLLQGCRLRNVTLSNVTLKDVGIIGARGSNCSLEKESLSNMFILNGWTPPIFTDTRLFRRVDRTRFFEMHHYTMPETAFSRLLRQHALNDGTDPGKSGLPDAYRDDAGPHMQVWQRKGKGFNFLEGLGHDTDSLYRILELLIPPGDCILYEFGPDDLRTVTSPQTAVYKAYDALFQDHPRGFDWPEYATTYFGSMRQLATAAEYSTLGYRAMRIHPSILLVARKFHKLGKPLLWDRSFDVRCSQRGAIAFLQDHVGIPLKSLTLYVRSAKDNNWQWRDIMKLVRHDFSYLVSVSLRVDQVFWTAISWHHRADRLVAPIDRWTEDDDREEREKGWKNELRQPHHFLREVGMIAAPAMRQCERLRFSNPDHDIWEGTLTTIVIDGVNSPGERKFVGALNQALRKVSIRRPRFVKRNGKEYVYKRTYY